MPDHTRTSNPLWKIWRGARVLVIAGGPSLTDMQVQAARPYVRRGELRVIGVNDAYRICNFLDVLYAADFRWWDHHEARSRNVPLRVTVDEDCAKKHGLTHIPGKAEGGLSLTADCIHQGNHSGFQALNLAVYMGATDILLLGFDMRVTDRVHWFGDHPEGVKIGNGQQFERFRNAYPPAARQLKELGISCINCSPDSAITCFPSGVIGEALAHGDLQMAG